MDNTQGENANRSTAARLQDLEKRVGVVEGWQTDFEEMVESVFSNPPAHADNQSPQEPTNEVDPGGGDTEGGPPLANSGTLENPYSAGVVSHLDHILEQLDAGHVAYCRGKLRDLRRKLGGDA